MIIIREWGFVTVHTKKVKNSCLRIFETFKVMLKNCLQELFF